MTFPNMTGALSGIKVLDLSRVLAGPWSTQILGDLGADVIKVESINGDDTRQWGPPFMENEAGDSAYYLSANRNKRSIVIDLSTPQGQALLKQLALKADVLIENFKFGGLEKYGLDAKTLLAAHPKLVYCSITGFGQSGPYRQRPGYDFVIQGMAGLMSITGTESSGPLRVGVAVTDLATGLYATVAILAALRHAEQTGQGQHLDVSLMDTQVSMLANQSLNYLVGGRPPGLIGNTHPTIVPYQVFKTNDRPLIVAVGNDGQFKAFCSILKCPEWASDERFSTNRQRVINRDQLVELIQQKLLTEGVEHWLEQLLAHNIPAGPVNRLDDVFNDPHVQERRMAQSIQRGEDVLPTVRFPVEMSQTPAAVHRPPPRLAEHTKEVLMEWLGMGAEEITALSQQRVVVE